MKANLFAALSGIVFAIGLAISGMTLPSKVIGFLDIGGVWDPSLAFVMVGAIAVHATLRIVIMRRNKPIYEDSFHLPKSDAIDGKLLSGAALFGIGWGIAGYCPGPVLASLASGAIAPVVFVATMALGMVLTSRLSSEG